MLATLSILPELGCIESACYGSPPGLFDVRVAAYLCSSDCTEAQLELDQILIQYSSPTTTNNSNNINNYNVNNAADVGTGTDISGCARVG